MKDTWFKIVFIAWNPFFKSCTYEIIRLNVNSSHHACLGIWVIFLSSYCFLHFSNYFWWVQITSVIRNNKPVFTKCYIAFLWGWENRAFSADPERNWLCDSRQVTPSGMTHFCGFKEGSEHAWNHPPSVSGPNKLTLRRKVLNCVPQLELLFQNILFNVIKGTCNLKAHYFYFEGKD